MRILFLHQFDLSLAGGSGVYLRALSAAFLALGHQVEVTSARRPDRYGCSKYQLPFTFPLTFGPERRDGERTLDELSVTQLRALSDIAAGAVENQALRRHRPDLLLVNHISVLAGAAQTLRQRYAIPYRLISYGTDTRLLRNAKYVDLYGPAAVGADRVFAISSFVADQLRATLPHARVELLGGAVDRSVFRPAPAAPEPANRMAFVGRLVSEKGIWILLAALNRLSMPAQLDIVGEGPLRSALREVVERTALPVRVNLLGYLPPERLREVLVRSSVLVVPSTWPEPLGLVVLEAMACGVPVIASAVGGIPEMVQHNANGLLVEPGDPAALARAISLVLGDPVLRARLREHCLNSTRISSYHDVASKALA